MELNDKININMLCSVMSVVLKQYHDHQCLHQPNKNVNTFYLYQWCGDLILLYYRNIVIKEVRTFCIHFFNTNNKTSLCILSWH